MRVVLCVGNSCETTQAKLFQRALSTMSTCSCLVPVRVWCFVWLGFVLHSWASHLMRVPTPLFA